jgi:hypothetical protein
MNKRIFTLFALILALNIACPAQSSSFKNNLIRGVKFLDNIEEVEWYRDKGKILVIGVGKGFRNISSIPITELVYAAA